MILVVGGIKGGSGKTTLATNLTVLRSKENKKVLLIDADEQKSTWVWSCQRESEKIITPWTTIAMSGSGVNNQIMKLKANYDDIIIDVGGRDTTTQRSCLTVADVFVAPFLPRSLDVWTAIDVQKLIHELLPINPGIKTYCIINRGDTIGSLSDNLESQKLLSKYPPLQMMPFIVSQRKSFANASTYGLGVSELPKEDIKAISEIHRLYDFIYKNDTINIPKT